MVDVSVLDTVKELLPEISTIGAAIAAAVSAAYAFVARLEKKIIERLIPKELRVGMKSFAPGENISDSIEGRMERLEKIMTVREARIIERIEGRLEKIEIAEQSISEKLIATEERFIARLEERSLKDDEDGPLDEGQEPSPLASMPQYSIGEPHETSEDGEALEEEWRGLVDDVLAGNDDLLVGGAEDDLLDGGAEPIDDASSEGDDLIIGSSDEDIVSLEALQNTNDTYSVSDEAVTIIRRDKHFVIKSEDSVETIVEDYFGDGSADFALPDPVQKAQVEGVTIEHPDGSSESVAFSVGATLSDALAAIEEIKEEVSEEKIVPVHFATNRARDFGRDEKHMVAKTKYTFTDVAKSMREIDDAYPGVEGDINYGLIDVRLPGDHREGHLESPSYWKFEFTIPEFRRKPNPEKHVTLASITLFDEDGFFEAVENSVQSTMAPEILVFIHGYNVSFVDAVRRTGQIAYDLRFPGTSILFSWPSKGAWPLYTHDKDASAGATTDLRDFIMALSQKTGATAIHVIAHSMGNVPLVEALHDIVISQGEDASPVLNEIILAAPDVRARQFKKLARAFPKAAMRTTLYASSTDRALKLSIKANGEPRAGDTSKEILVVDSVETVDATNLNTDFFGLGHSYIGDDRTVINDLFHVVRNHHPPNLRKLDLIPVPSEEPATKKGYWAFSP